ncbi:diguanylate cyclase [Sinorhizobium numidicum]|uniref:Diguanylate cyclase n=1 Tax=Sinorhizobium numidicum TaxID=680248 RepID=A0ABY8CYC4_9HYPH|nr:diguanylate cyclase [Sinorhizobium numidicum]WEX76213.1 diguanylate cyclase [Sinorhizobium numidicum]WEX82872.1 diguanylate cyclase [Sinorhizobium numidicum]
MAIASPSPKQVAQQIRRDLYYNAFATLERMQIDASPINYELMCEIISGNNPELREKFARLGKDITEEDLDVLARIYLPHHFGKSIHDESADRIQSELTTLKASLQSGQTSLSSYTSMLGQATGSFSSIDPTDMKKIQSQLQAIRQATEIQQSKSTEILESVSTQMSAFAAIASDLDEFERMKFTHIATKLANRRGFNKKLADLYGGERYPDGASLILCNLLVLEPFERKELLKVKEAILQRLGPLVSQTVQATDCAAWLDRPQVGIIVSTSAEAEIRRIAEQVRNSCLRVFNSQRQGMPVVAARFGCSTTYEADTAFDLVNNAEKALEIATETADDKVVFFANSEAGGARKDWMLYRR